MMLQKKANKAKKKQKKIELKEIKLKTCNRNYMIILLKLKMLKNLYQKGDKVKFTIKFKGRELRQHSHLGNELMDKIKARYARDWKSRTSTKV